MPIAPVPFVPHWLITIRHGDHRIGQVRGLIRAAMEVVVHPYVLRPDGLGIELSAHLPEDYVRRLAMHLSGLLETLDPHADGAGDVFVYAGTERRARFLGGIELSPAR